MIGSRFSFALVALARLRWSSRRTRRCAAPQPQAQAIPPELALDRTLPIDPAVRDRAAAERPALFPAAEQPAGKARLDAAGRERRRDPGGSGPARPRAFPRAHGVQRHRALQAGRAGVVPRIDRRAVRPARQRVDVVRRDHLHARHPDRQAGLPREGHAGAARFRRRHFAAARRGREGTRRRARRVARAPRRRLAPHRQAAADHLPGLALRRAPADRLARGPEERAARAAAGVLREVVSPRQHGGGGGRRSAGRPGREAGAGNLRQDSGGEGRAGERRYQRAGAQGHADQHVDRSGSAGLVGVDRVQGQGRTRH